MAASAEPALEIALQNAGDSDFTINLGIVLANGKYMTPSALRLAVTDGSGTTRELHYADRRYAGVAGRLDDYAVPLAAGATYVVRTTAGQFWDPERRDVFPKLNGRVHVAAIFEGHGARTSNLDMRGVALMNFWRGVARSNAIELVLPAVAAR